MPCFQGQFKDSPREQLNILNPDPVVLSPDTTVALNDQNVSMSDSETDLCSRLVSDFITQLT